ncbi:MAG: MFS transporter [Burkholderiales bacterium]|nr:MFS transporter [Burkholderiales bacterium]
MNFTNILDFMIMMPLATHLMREFAIDTAQFGVLVSAYAFAAAASSLLMATLADRFDRKHALLVVYVGLIVGTLGCALAPSYAALLVARTVAGLFGGVQGSIAFSIVGDLVPDQRRGRAMGIVMLSFSLAAVLGVPLSIYAASQGGWHVPFFALAATCTLLLAVAWRMIPPVRGHLRRGPPSGFWQGYAELFRVPNHWWGFATSALLTLSGMLVIPYVAASRVHSEGMSESELSWFYLVGGAVTLFTRPLFGRMSDRYPRAVVYYWLMLASILPMVLITHRTGASFGWQLVISALFFIFVSGRFVPATALLTSATVPQMRGRMMAFGGAVQNLFTGIAAAVGGAMLQKTDTSQLVGYEAVGYLACLCGMASLWTAFKVRAVS